MYYRGSRGVTYSRTLSDDDVAGVCYLYPSSSRPCVTDADCPLIDNPYGGAEVATVCNSGTCGSAKRAYGQDCFTNATCTSNVCVRFDEAVSPNPGVCTTACPCSNGDVCSNGYCAPRAAGCVDSCGANRACAQDVDGYFECIPVCVEDGDCPMSAALCVGAIDADDAGLCRVPGAKADDVLCDDPSECASLICGVSVAGYGVCVGDELATPTVFTPTAPTEPTEPPGPTEPTEPTAPTPPTDPTEPNDVTNGVSDGCTTTQPSAWCSLLAALWFVRPKLKVGVRRRPAVPFSPA